MARLRFGNVTSAAKTLLKKKSPKSSTQTSPVGLCQNCSHTLSTPTWCKRCQATYFSSVFSTWTSSSSTLDTVIQSSQLNAEHEYNYVEWINYDKIKDITLCDKGHFSVVYKGIWLDGPRKVWDEKRGWTRSGETKVVMKALNENNDITFNELVRELELNIKCSSQSRGVLRCYGITQDPSTKSYMLVLEYCLNGNLHNFLETSFATLQWPSRLSLLHSVISGIRIIHDKELVHRDIHSGNVFIKANLTALVGDLGLCRSILEPFTSKSINGVMPYIAPESLCGLGFSKSSDIYAFGMLMWELTTGTVPFPHRDHNSELAYDICNGSRPRIVAGTPRCYMQLMQRCWSEDPAMRPKAEEVCTLIEQWLHDDVAHTFGDEKVCEDKTKVHNNGWKNKIKKRGFGTKVFHDECSNC